MDRLMHKQHNLKLRKNRVRAVIAGTAQRPRMSVFISNKHVAVQIIDDIDHKTLVSVTTAGNKAAVGTMTEKAAMIGGEIAKKAQAAKVKRVVLDRNGKLYHGRVQALADAARKAGLEF